MNGWFSKLLEQARFLQRYPHYAGVLARMTPVDSVEFAYMAVSLERSQDPHPTLRLYCNAGYFCAHPEHFVAVLQHEIHHVVYGHLQMSALHRAGRPFLLELAMEMSANEDIVEPFPGPGVVWQGFTFCGVAAGQSTMTRFRLLQEAEASGDLSIVSDQELDAICPGWRERQERHDADHKGPRVLVRNQLGHIGGSLPPQVLTPRLRDDHRIAGHGGRHEAGLGDELDSGLDGARGGAGRGVLGLGGLTGAQELDGWKLRIQQHLARGRCGSAWDFPGARRSFAKELSRAVAAAGGGRGLDWPRILREFVPQQRITRTTLQRPNRRFPQRIGQVPGRQRRPALPHVLAAVDTSASMGDDVLGRVAGELRRLARHAKVTVVESDAAVHRVYPVRAVLTMIGGGDTDYLPALALSQAEAGRCAALIYFTDGKGAWPGDGPRVPVLWVLTNEDPFACPYGVCVRLPG